MSPPICQTGQYCLVEGCRAVVHLTGCLFLQVPLHSWLGTYGGEGRGERGERGGGGRERGEGEAEREEGGS